MDWHAKDMEKLRNQLEESEPDDFETTDNITVDPKPVDSKNAKDVMKKLKNDILSFTKKKDRVLHLQSNSGLWVDLTDDNGCSPLHLAVEDKCVCLAESLILAGSNVNVSEGCGITPVMIAVNNNQPDIVMILVKYGARNTSTEKENRNLSRKYTKSSSDSNANWKS